MPRRPYIPNEVLILHYGSVLVGRTPTAEEADALNRGEMPWETVEKITRPRGKVHFFPECRGHDASGKGLSRSVQDTTCRHCLIKRAMELRGLRWTLPDNAEEVAYLTLMLSDRVNGFDAPQPGDDRLRRMLGMN